MPGLGEQFLDAYEREHATTMRVLRAYPEDRLDLRPHGKCKTARELAWVFVVERGLGTRAYNNELAGGLPSGEPPPPPESWSETVKFMTGPKMMGDVRRIDLLWLLLHDQIHHRGQFSIYLRMADGRVPSIYGPTADEPWR
jgi:hypothetical protein